MEKLEVIERYGEWLPASDLAKALGISQSSVYSALRRRGLNPYKIAKQQRRKAALDAIEDEEYAMRERAQQQI